MRNNILPFRDLSLITPRGEASAFDCINHYNNNYAFRFLNLCLFLNLSRFLFNFNFLLLWPLIFYVGNDILFLCIPVVLYHNNIPYFKASRASLWSMFDRGPYVVIIMHGRNLAIRRIVNARASNVYFLIVLPFTIFLLFLNFTPFAYRSKGGNYVSVQYLLIRIGVNNGRILPTRYNLRPLSTITTPFIGSSIFLCIRRILVYSQRGRSSCASLIVYGLPLSTYHIRPINGHFVPTVGTVKMFCGCPIRVHSYQIYIFECSSSLCVIKLCNIQ